MTAHSVVWPPSALDPLAGLPCNSIRTGNDHLIVLGFGNLIATRSATGEIKERSSWRIGTVNCGWRVVKDDVILVGTTDPDHHWREINVKLSALTLGAFQSLEHVGRYDLKVRLDNGLVIEFLKVSTIGDIAIIVYGPDELAYSYRASTGWIVGVDSPDAVVLLNPRQEVD